MSRTPFAEDLVVAEAAEKAAERLGMELFRQRPVTITDLRAIKAAGLMKEAPDYRRIRALLNDGVAVEGASLGPVEYTLRVPGVKE